MNYRNYKVNNNLIDWSIQISLKQNIGHLYLNWKL